LQDDPDDKEWEGVDWFAVAAESLALDEEAPWESLDAGQSLAQIAEAQGVDPQAIVAAIVAAENAFLDDLAVEKELAPEEIAEWQADVAAEAQSFVDKGWTEKDDKEWEGVDWFAVAAESLALDEDAPWESLDAGQSLAQIAEAQGVDPQAIVAAIVAAENAFIDDLAAEWKAQSAVKAESFVNEGWDKALDKDKTVSP